MKERKDYIIHYFYVTEGKRKEFTDFFSQLTLEEFFTERDKILLDNEILSIWTAAKIEEI